MKAKSNIHTTMVNIAKDSKLASTRFLKALERIPALMENYARHVEKAAKDIPVLEKEENSQWLNENELRKLKNDLATPDRKIQMIIGENSTNINVQNKDTASQTFLIPSEKKAVHVPELRYQNRI